MSSDKGTGVIYLLHFSEPYGARGVQHYLGRTDRPLEERIAEHGTTSGAALLRAVVEAGLTFHIAATWEGGYEEEKRMKALKKSWREWCPTCLKGEREPRGLIQ